MSPSEIERLFISWQHAGDERAHRRLVAIYRPLAGNLASRYHSDDPVATRERVAAAALLVAIDAYEIAEDAGFVAHAVPSILGALRRHCGSASPRSGGPVGSQNGERPGLSESPGRHQPTPTG